MASSCWRRSTPMASPSWPNNLAFVSIPAVFAVRDGKAVDGFVGVQPESMIRTWIDRLLPTPAEALAAQARLLERSDPKAAEEKYGEAVARPRSGSSTGRAGASPSIRAGSRRHRLDSRAGAARVSRARGRDDQGRVNAPPPGRADRQPRGPTPARPTPIPTT